MNFVVTHCVVNLTVQDTPQTNRTWIRGWSEAGYNKFAPLRTITGSLRAVRTSLVRMSAQVCSQGTSSAAPTLCPTVVSWVTRPYLVVHVSGRSKSLSFQILGDVLALVFSVEY